jgi:hypothetical protein
MAVVVSDAILLNVSASVGAFPIPPRNVAIGWRPVR